MDHQEILKQIGNSLDIELAFDEHGQCFLLLDEHLMVSVRSVDHAWVLYGMLGKLEEDKEPADIAHVLLAMNLPLVESGSGSIVLEPTSNVLMLVSRIATTEMDGERMQEILGDFVDALDKAMKAFNERRRKETESPSVPASSAHFGMFNRA